MGNKLILLLAILIFPFLLSAQILSVNKGQSHTRSKTKSPIVDEFCEFLNVDEYYFIRFEQNHFKKKFWVAIDLAHYSEFVHFSLNADTWNGYGVRGIDIWRLGLYFGMDLIPKVRRLDLIPFFAIQIEQSLPTTESGYGPYLGGKNDGTLIRGRGFYHPIERVSIIPAVGVNLDWNMFWRFHLKLDLYYSQGYSPHSKLTYEYTIDDVPQPTGKWVADGTGFFFAAGLGYKLWGYKKNK